MFTARCFRASLSFLAFSFFSVVSWAQVDTGTILGTVRDSSGAIIAGATVTVRDEGTAFTQTTKTSSAGEYAFTP